jgi:hypothetical protein
MNIRLMGTRAEIEQAVKILARTEQFEQAEFSNPRRNHDGRGVRVYANVRIEQWCDRSWHDGDCCAGSRREYGIRPVRIAKTGKNT